MSSKVISGLKILQQQGPVSLSIKTSLFLAQYSSIGRQILYDKSKEQIREQMGAEEGLEDILDTVLDAKPGYSPYQVFTMQLRDEIKTLTNLVEKEQPLSILEIGTARGGSLYIWSRHLDSVDRIISLDLPGGRFGGGYDERKIEIFREFSPSKKMDFIAVLNSGP